MASFTSLAQLHSPSFTYVSNQAPDSSLYRWTGTAGTDGWVNSDVKVGMHSSEPWIIQHAELDWKRAFTGLKAGFASSLPLPVVTQE